MAIEMATGRRSFLGGLLAAGLLPQPSWADAGSPVLLSAAAHPDGRYVLCGIDADLNIAFQIALPARGHATAAHPSRPEAITFARRPGTFAIVFDCVTGQQLAMLISPEGRHFYGHGTFSADGSLLFTTENDFETGVGCIGVWDAANGYTRVDESRSGGIGPHDIKRLPGSDVLVIANGGIDTHPDTGRTKLNIPTMRPNLAYIQDGVVLEVAELPPGLHKNSIRHLAVMQDRPVVFGMQWQGEEPAAALAGTHQRGAPVSLLKATERQIDGMNGYVGSITYSSDGHTIAMTSPRGGCLQCFDTRTGRLSSTMTLNDVCGVAAVGQSLIATSGTGEIIQIEQQKIDRVKRPNRKWDNHLIAL